MQHQFLMFFLLVNLSAEMHACMDPIPPNTLTGEENGTLSGIVKDSCKNSGLVDVEVSLRPYDAKTGGSTLDQPPTYITQTNSSGQFWFEGIKVGLWQLNFQKRDFQATEKIIQVLSGGKIDMSPVSLISLSDLMTDANKKLDILFVVDNSNSMAEEQQLISQAFPSFINALMPFSFMLDLHIGVVSTDLGAGDYHLPSCEVPKGDQGKLQNTPRIAGCHVPKDPFIALSENKTGITTNVPNDMINDAFSCIVLLGVGGCGFEQPLASILQALDSKTNPGFFRSDALLGIIVLSDEDDCSVNNPGLFDPGEISQFGPLNSFRCFRFGVNCECAGGNKCAPETVGVRQNCQPGSERGILSVDSFYSKLTSLYSSRRIFFSVIAGPTQNISINTSSEGDPTLAPSCLSSTGSATPAIRLQAVAKRFAPNSSFDTICIDNLGQSLTNIAKEMAKQALVSSCIQ